MTEEDFINAKGEFLAILSKQPNAVLPMSPGNKHGEDLAEYMFAFIRKFHELKNKALGQSQP